MTIPETIDAILADLERGLKTPAEVKSLIRALGVTETLADEMIGISQGESDIKTETN